MNWKEKFNEKYTIDCNRLLYKQRVMLDNKTVSHKNKKRYNNKYKCRGKVKI